MAVAADQRIVSMLADLKADDPRFVSIVDDIIAVLHENKQAWQQTIPPRRVGIDFSNRSGFGVSSIEVHALGSEIVRMGWSWQACSHATCIHDSASNEIAKFTIEQQQKNHGLGVVPAAEIQFGALACCHTNQFLVAALTAAPTEHENLAIDGKMSASKLSESDQKLSTALTDGMKWTVLSADVRKLYPELPNVISEARNATGRAQRNKSEFEVLVEVQSMVQEHASGEAVNWTRISKAIHNRTGMEQSDIDIFLRFVQMYGGGSTGKFISELDYFKKTFVPSGRIVPLSTFQAILDIKLSANDLCPYFCSAIVKTQASCPKQKAPNNVCRFITSSDIGALAGARKQHMLEAEVVLRTARDIIKNTQTTPDIQSSLQKAVGRLDTLMCRHVMRKDDTHKSIDAVGSLFVKEVNEIFVANRLSKIDDPWMQASSATSNIGQSTSSTPNLIQYDESGKPIAVQKVHLLSSGP